MGLYKNEIICNYIIIFLQGKHMTGLSLQIVNISYAKRALSQTLIQYFILHHDRVISRVAGGRWVARDAPS